jgi:hypothetical protein
MKTLPQVMGGLAVGVVAAMAAGTAQAQAIDNRSIGKPELRDHKAACGLVYKLPEGINTFKDVSIVEIAFAGNVLREIYRVSLENGSVIDVATGKEIPGMKKS